jgi:Holliday junction resolvase RusA-like endonuclease
VISSSDDPDRKIRWYQLHVNPEPWAVGPLSIGKRNGRPTATMGRNQQLDAYKHAIREELETTLPNNQTYILPPYYSLDMFFWRNRAEYTTPQARTHRKHEADVTNLQKATEDALQGILIGNDRDVIRIASYMMDQGPDVTGGVLLRIEWDLDREDATANLPRLVQEEAIAYRPLRLVPPITPDDNAWPPRS